MASVGSNPTPSAILEAKSDIISVSRAPAKRGLSLFLLTDCSSIVIRRLVGQDVVESEYCDWHGRDSGYRCLGEVSCWLCFKR